jgi:alkaline phosphatase D
MASSNVNVRWEIATDDGMRQVVKRGHAVASPDFAHSVHAEVSGLEPDRWYWYRFDAGGTASPVGRARTMPRRDARPERLRFVFASCQHYEQGFYAAHRHLAQEPIDFVAFLGDYIYESNTADPVRAHGSGEPTTLDAYRERYAVYKRDTDLQAAHAACPWIVTFDDHEVDNNYVGALAQDDVPVAEFQLRRAAAYRAYYEHMPLRRSSLPRGPDMLLYRTLDFGRLATFQVLDTRQYRSDQACGDGRRPICDSWAQAERTVMGERQERWLARGLSASRATWNVLAQQIMMVPFEVDPSPVEAYNMDSWSGYPGGAQAPDGPDRRPAGA